MSHTGCGKVEVPLTFGALVKEARAAAKQSQPTVARRAKITREYLSRIENGQVNPSLRVALRVFRALGIDPEYFGDLCESWPS